MDIGLLETADDMDQDFELAGTTPLSTARTARDEPVGKSGSLDGGARAAADAQDEERRKKAEMAALAAER